PCDRRKCHRAIAQQSKRCPRGRVGLLREALARATFFAFLVETNKRKMPQRRHGAPLDKADHAGSRGPSRIALERKLRAPAELACGWRKSMLERPPQSGLGADAADQHDLAARLQDAGELVERGLRVRH